MLFAEYFNGLPMNLFPWFIRFFIEIIIENTWIDYFEFVQLFFLLLSVVQVKTSQDSCSK